MSRPIPADRSRSPRFPSHSLDQAIVFANKIYAGVHRSPVDSMTAMQLMGFAGKSGASATALGSIRQFGLIDGTGDKTRISDLALKIFEPIDDLEKALAVHEAALYPSVFGQILERFSGRLPTANEPLRAFLIRELGFSKSGANDCLESIRTTLQFADSFAIMPPIARVIETESDGQPDAVEKSSGTMISQEPPSRGSNFLPEQSDEHMLIPLTKNCRASLQFHGTITEKAIANLVKHIELMKEVWTED